MGSLLAQILAFSFIAMAALGGSVSAGRRPSHLDESFTWGVAQAAFSGSRLRVEPAMTDDNFAPSEGFSAKPSMTVEDFGSSDGFPVVPAMLAGSPEPTAPTVMNFSVAELERELLIMAPVEFQTVAVTWPGDDDDPQPVAVRTLGAEDQVWSQWFPLEANLTGPQEALADQVQQPRIGSESIYVGSAVAVEIAPLGLPNEAPVTELPAEVEVVLIGSNLQPVTSKLEISQTSFLPYTGFGVTTQISEAAAGKPAVITREQWGAEPVKCHIETASQLQGVIIHHTASGNSYSTPAEAAQQIRNIQAYHQSLGWCDLGYNVVVDKWGNIYEGRAGSLTEPVIGAHAAGFNKGTLGITMLGNYSEAEPSAEMLEAVGRVAGWKLAEVGIDPAGTYSYTTAGGSPLWSAGTTVTLSAITEHREVGRTECPGTGVYGKAEVIRNAALLQAGKPLAVEFDPPTEQTQPSEAEASTPELPETSPEPESTEPSEPELDQEENLPSEPDVPLLMHCLWRSVTGNGPQSWRCEPLRSRPRVQVGNYKRNI
jgi:hypothetical protein